MSTKIMAVDPGTNKAGVAVMWRADDKKTIVVEKHFLIRPEKSDLKVLERTRQICEQISDIAHE